eukprot:365276-Chlamydomonas_euryale.AAC.11
MAKSHGLGSKIASTTLPSSSHKNSLCWEACCIKQPADDARDKRAWVEGPIAFWHRYKAVGGQRRVRDHVLVISLQLRGVLGAKGVCKGDESGAGRVHGRGGHWEVE